MAFSSLAILVDFRQPDLTSSYIILTEYDADYDDDMNDDNDDNDNKTNNISSTSYRALVLPRSAMFLLRMVMIWTVLMMTTITMQ